MKNCENCGFQMFDRETKCPNCGHEDGSGNRGLRSSGNDHVSVGLVILTILIPIVGVGLYFGKRREQPSAAKVYLAIGIILWVLNFIILLNTYMKDFSSNYQNIYNQNQNEYQYDQEL